MKKYIIGRKKYIKPLIKSVFWFSTGVLLGLFLFISFIFVLFQKKYDNVVFPGVMVNGINFGGKTQKQVEDFFLRKNEAFSQTQFVFTHTDTTIPIKAKDIQLGYNTTLLAHQAYSIGRSDNVVSNIDLVIQAYINGINLPASYSYSENSLENILVPITTMIKVAPVDALFTFENGKVSAFQPSSDGQEIDMDAIKKYISSKMQIIVQSGESKTFSMTIPIKIIKATVTTDKANNLGIKELIGMGTSLFAGSIPNRIDNITLAAKRINGILVTPGEIFSFDKTLGDISQFTGYKQAYVIENGHTILGDGGGVCQVSTTFFRALLNAGLPITERNAHAYRVHYYEEDSPPGIDATIYVPTVDLKFKNDTNNSILIQSMVDPVNEQITILLYGAKDGREVTLTKPVITSETPPPDPLYQDDPTLPKGVVKQVDFAAGGARVSFSREVKKNGKVIIQETFVSNYKPWQAVFLKGTQ